MKYLALFLFCAALTSAAPSTKKISRKVNGRIVGGHPANAGQFPFAAALYHSTTSGRFFCGATLINTRWVMTAANCVFQSTTFTIYLGSNNLNSDDPNQVVLSTSTYIIHPNFDPETIANDIGLIEFRAPITLTDYIQPVYLPSIDLLDNLRVIALGWGSVSDTVSDLSNHLNSVELSTIPQNDCEKIYGDQIHENMICVAGSFNEGACRGDIGGPLVITLNNHAWYVGVSSFISGNGCESPDPSGYTRVYPYLDWIKTVTGTA